MSLSDRIRLNCEAAPWVIEEVKQMEKEISLLKQDLRDADMRKQDTERLIFLIEQELVVIQGINSFWLAEPDGTSRVGDKHTTSIQAIDSYMELLK